MKISIAFISPFARVVIDNKSARSLDFTMLKEKLESTFNADILVVSKRTNKEREVGYYLNFSEEKILVDSIIIHNYNANIFGGVITNLTLDYIRFMTNNKRKKFFFYITDPKLKYFNVPKYILSRTNLKFESPISVEELEHHAVEHESIEANMRAIFTGYNYKDIYGLPFSNTGIVHLKVFSMIANSNLCVPKKNSEIDYEICYYGDNRGSYRNNKLKKFLDTPYIDSLIIGFEIPLKGATFSSKVSNQDLKPLVRQCLSSLIIGDAEHENAFITFRFYESICWGVVSFIDLQYDTDKKLFEHPTLKEFNYIVDQQDLINKISRLKADTDFRFKIIELQKQELKTNKLLC